MNPEDERSALVQGQANGSGGGIAMQDYNAMRKANEDTDLDDEDVHESGGSGDFVKSIIFGGLDGLNTSFAIIAGASGANLEGSTVVLLGFSSVVACSLAMGINEYASSRAHREFVMSEKRRAIWEFKQYRANEIRQMVLKLERRGMSKADADLVVSKMAQYESLFVNMMVTEELGFRLSEEDDEYLLADAFIMFLSFFGFGIIPLIVYFVGLLYSLKEQVLFFVSAGLIVLGLFSMGAVKSAFSSVSWIYAGAETLSIGVLCAGAAYGVANLIANIIDAIV